MPVAPHRQQITISDDREIVQQIDALAAQSGLSRNDLYAIAIRALLNAPQSTIARSIVRAAKHQGGS